MMKPEAGGSNSIWMDTAPPRIQNRLTEDAHADVCIVGAGIAGMTTAYFLAREGLSVIVLDDGDVAAGETARTTAHITNALDDHYTSIERVHGPEKARLAAESHTAAIRAIEKIVWAEHIDCEFERVDGFLFLAPGESRDYLRKEMEAAQRAGLRGVSLVDQVPYEGYHFGPAVLFPGQAQFHAVKYINGLTRALLKAGGRIFTKTHAEEIEGGEVGRVKTSRGPQVTSTHVVVATNTPVNNMVAIHTKQAAYRSYVVGARIPKGVFPPILLWDTGKPYHYIRLARTTEEDYDVLIVGGEDHKTGDADDAEQRYGRLRSWTQQRFPMVDSFLYQWSGQIMEPIDGLAFIGHNPMDFKNVFVATGDSGNGITHGTIAGMLLGDLIVGRKNSWKDLYDPSRFPISSVNKFAKDAMDVVSHYGDFFSPQVDRTAMDLKPGEGVVYHRDMKRIAACRDQKGVIHEFSAFCPHLGCVVMWNHAERTWDCPCHGSRFDGNDGHVLNGPSNEGLSEA